MSKLLVTTALEETYLEGREAVLLGEWCKSYAKRDVWAARDHEVLPYHRDIPGKRYADYEYLLKLYRRLLPRVAAGLNAIHGLAHPVRYWEIVTGLWLQTYISAVHDRWESVRNAFANHAGFDTVTLVPIPELLPPSDYLGAIRQLTSDEYNYTVFLDALRAAYPGRCSFIEASVKRMRVPRAAPPQPAPTARWSPRRTVHAVVRAAVRLLGAASARSDVVMFGSYFPRSALVRINLLLGQAPRLHEELEYYAMPEECAGIASACLRTRLAEVIGKGGDDASGFEAFLLQRLPNELPLVHVEGYEAMKRRALALAADPKVIFTANAHWANDFFKLWSAECVLRGSRLIISDHGGSLPPDQYVFDVEENIADVYVPTFKESHPQHKLLPPSKYVGARPACVRSPNCLTLVSYDTGRYLVRAAAHPYSTQVLRCYDDSLRFHDALPEEPRKAFRVKPPPFDQALNSGWDLTARYRDRLGGRALLNGMPLEKAFRMSRLLVCTYPQSTLTEAMLSGVPTIMFFDPALHGLHGVGAECLRALTRARIVFFDPEAAAAHAADVWDDPRRWWGTADVTAAKDLFFASTMNCQPGPHRLWAEFFKRQASAVARSPSNSSP